MAERKSQLLQILIGEIGQDVKVNIVGGKGLGALLQPDAPEPQA